MSDHNLTDTGCGHHPGGYSEYVCTAGGLVGDGYVGAWKGAGLVEA